jgi:hypothetical protein
MPIARSSRGAFGDIRVPAHLRLERAVRGFVAEEYHSRDECRQSGVYRAVHEPQHTPDHDVTVLFGRIFPRCSHHGCNPKFVLMTPGQNIHSNNWFK